jgi:tetratricopeptide (TPR) repeat protein
MHRLILAVLSIVSTLTFGLPLHAQLDSQALLHEGNSLFRSGLYRAALLRYREASALGLDSALLAYNLGVTYYELGDYADAERSFERAGEDPDLAQLAAYNLGLTYRASGRAAEAGQAFAAVERSATNRDLRRLAARAAAGLAAPAEASRPQPSRAAAPERSGKRAPGLSLTMNAAYGHSDNANRTPAEPYVDLAQPGQPTVTPEPLSASYVPLNVIAEYAVPNEAGDTDYYFRYRLDGEYYTDELANDESNQRLDVGADIAFGERTNRNGKLRSAFFVTRNFQRNFDPDNGLDREILGLDISPRFNYGGAGIEADFDHSIGKWRWGVEMHLERREHDRVPLVANYDNELYLLGASAAYSINPATTVTVGMRAYRRMFDERLARNLDGAMLSTNPAIEYGYQGIELGVKRKISRYIELDLSYLLLDRTDRFVGYDDYAQDVLRLRATIDPGPRFSISFDVLSRVYEYPNAFAFNTPGADSKEIDDLSGELQLEFRINRNFVLFAQLATSEVTSTDARAEYSRAQTMLGVSWRR